MPRRSPACGRRRVRIKELGLGKDERALEKKGLLPKEPEPELLLKRLEVLRTHRWSSYPAYAGYVEKPAWLHCDELWWRGNEGEWRRLLPFEDVVKAVESVKGEPWSDFVNRHGDQGRDLSLYVGRLRCALTLKKLGGYTGMKSQAVCQGTLRVKRRLEEDKELKKDYNKVLELLDESDG